MYNEMMASFTSLNAKIDWVNNVAYEDGWETQSIESIKESLQIDLNNAIAEERYEDAASIRDQLRQLGQ
jgi:protein-arginine kinase activator protein McsA